MELIDRDKLKEYIDNCECCEKCDQKGFMCDVCCDLPDCVTPQWERVLDEQQTVDAVPIEWINQRVKGLKIQLINADEDDVDLIWHLRDEIQTLTELKDYWKEEQGKQK